MTTRLPLTVIGGFLGAGKTTLLNHWLADAQGQRLAVLVNDFGALNIDAAQLAASGADTIALSNGCVCCSIGDDLSAALIRVLEAQPPFDGVIIEASGVSDPWKVAQVGLADPSLALNAVIVLVDAAAVVEQSCDPLLSDSLERQLKAADLVVVNKVDLAGPAQRTQVLQWLDRVASDVPRVETQNARLPQALRSGPRLPRDGLTPKGHAHDHAQQFTTWIARPAQTFCADALRAALKRVPRGVLRLKGFVQTEQRGWCELQFAGRHGSLRPIDPVPGDGVPVLVAIGLRGRLPAAALDAWVEAASASPTPAP